METMNDETMKGILDIVGLALVLGRTRSSD
jgi:hypothetical protein